MLGKSRSAALGLYERLRADPRFLPGFPPELDIVVWIPRARRISEAALHSRRIYEEAARRKGR